MAGAKITLALGSYDRHGPLLESCIQHSGVDVQYIELDPQQGRHERFLRDFEFDAAELSFSSYLIAVDQGLPVHAVPVFPRRLFSQSQMYKNTHCGIESPMDLMGKKIGLSGYQNTLAVRAKGDLTHFYGVPRATVTWVTPGKEVIHVVLPADVKIESRASMDEIEQEFIEGKVQAMFVSRLPKPFREGNPNVTTAVRRRVSRRRALSKRGRLFPYYACAGVQIRFGRAVPALAESAVRYLRTSAPARRAALGGSQLVDGNVGKARVGAAE
jgi:4,5-dihydroxyphthalate decarboxylase